MYAKTYSHEFSVGKNLCVTHNEKNEGQIRDLRVSPKPTNYSQHTPRANTGYHSMQEISKTFQQVRMTKE